MATKKIGSMGRFGARYGTRTKGICLAIEKLQKQSHECPYCERKALTRLAAGIWKCGKCGAKFAGGAYMPKSAVFEQIQKGGTEKNVQMPEVQKGD